MIRSTSTSNSKQFLPLVLSDLYSKIHLPVLFIQPVQTIHSKDKRLNRMIRSQIHNQSKHFRCKASLVGSNWPDFKYLFSFSNFVSQKTWEAIHEQHNTQNWVGNDRFQCKPALLNICFYEAKSSRTTLTSLGMNHLDLFKRSD